MMVIEMREAAQQKAMDLIEETYDLFDESKKIERQKKMVLCELEDTLYDCFEDAKDDDKETERTDEGTDLGFKNKYNRHYAMRNFDDDDEMSPIHSYRRSRGMRRNRMGRFA